jgi:hypothetical protein
MPAVDDKCPSYDEDPPAHAGKCCWIAGEHQKQEFSIPCFYIFNTFEVGWIVGCMR